MRGEKCKEIWEKNGDRRRGSEGYGIFRIYVGSVVDIEVIWRLTVDG